MNLLFLDTETHGLIIDKFVSFDEPESWPPIKQIAWQIFDLNKNLIKEENIFISPHIKNNSLSIETAIERLLTDFKIFNPTIIGHNILFDKNVIGAELLRLKIINSLISLKYICTMKQSAEFCDLPNRKWPTLQELYTTRCAVENSLKY